MRPCGLQGQAPLSMGFSRETRVLECHTLLQGIFPTKGLNWVSCTAGRFFTAETPGKPPFNAYSPQSQEIGLHLHKALFLAPPSLSLPRTKGAIRKIILTLTLDRLHEGTELNSGSPRRTSQLGFLPPCTLWGLCSRLSQNSMAPLIFLKL